MIAKRLQDFGQSDAIRRRLVDWAPVGTLVFLCILLASGSQRFLTIDNFINIFEQSTTVLIMGIGQTFIILMGGIDLSVAALASLASVLTALLVPIVGIWTFPIVLLFGLVAGYLVGLVHGRLRIPSFIATLGALGVWTGLAFTISNATPIAISPDDGAAVDWVRGDFFGLPNEIWIVVVTLIVAVVIERLTRFGRFVFAIGAGEEAARLSGVPVIRYKIMAFALCGMFSAFSGFVLAARLSGGSARLADGLLAQSHCRGDSGRHGHQWRLRWRAADAGRRADCDCAGNGYESGWDRSVVSAGGLRRGGHLGRHPDHGPLAGEDY